jgi:hypothetical protein
METPAVEEAVGGIATVEWCVPPSERKTIVTAMATSTPSPVATVPALVRNRGVRGAMLWCVDIVPPVVVMSRGATQRFAR